MQEDMLDQGYSFDTLIPKSGKSAGKRTVRVYFQPETQRGSRKPPKREYVGTVCAESASSRWAKVDDLIADFEGDEAEGDDDDASLDEEDGEEDDEGDDEDDDE